MTRPRRQVSDSPRLRRSRLAAIHVAKKQFGLDDEPYRDLLELLTGKRSCAKMSAAELVQVLEYFRKHGFRQQRGLKPLAAALKKTAARIEAGARPQEALILDLWEDLLRLGGRGYDARLSSFMSRMGIAVDHPRFLTTAQAIKVTEGLKAWLKRAKAKRGLE